MPNKLTIGSCFSGIGGIELGLEWTGGFETKWQIENDEYATRVLAKHWPHVKRYGDIRDVSFPERVDVITSGFPCQDVSLAGERKGLEGKRSTLWSESFRLICEVKPRWVVAENVPGLLSSDGGRFFGKIIRDLAGGGYRVRWRMLSSCGVGHSHMRYRVFIVAHSSGERRAFSPLMAAGKNGSPREVEHSHEKTRDTRNCSLNRLRMDSLRRAVESGVRGMALRVPNQMDRLRCLGNAVDPHVAQKIGEMILNAI